MSCLHVSRVLPVSFHSATADSEMERSGIELALRKLVKNSTQKEKAVQVGNILCLLYFYIMAYRPADSYEYLEV
ncbi:hypothetical protein H8S37_02830 [Mediterraneibacter sp. NSJ-55]|uniref:Uncharacterized protein n=1 Tax=Mediterraneibacter hominis TaxID=2763054 RepID=A0A923LGJ0_9FIRM|nr:hypothetical protein [Mediterraneibacter hominis]MBC5687874.1 hypothetical protein [Mediterraneibacter hominis]